MRTVSEKVHFGGFKQSSEGRSSAVQIPSSVELMIYVEYTEEEELPN